MSAQKKKAKEQLLTTSPIDCACKIPGQTNIIVAERNNGRKTQIANVGALQLLLILQRVHAQIAVLRAGIHGLAVLGKGYGSDDIAVNVECDGVFQRLEGAPVERR